MLSAKLAGSISTWRREVTASAAAVAARAPGEVLEEKLDKLTVLGQERNSTNNNTPKVTGIKIKYAVI